MVNKLKELLSCENCALCAHRKNVVLGRGKLPADVLFIGEAPGKSEDVLGEAFIGQSGKLLDKLLKGFSLTYYITNTVLCIPLGADGNIREPQPSEIYRCYPNLKRIVHEVRPKKVCFIGKVAEKYLKPYFPNAVKITHPAYMLRTGGEYSIEFIKAQDVFKNLNVEEVYQ